MGAARVLPRTAHGYEGVGPAGPLWPGGLRLILVSLHSDAPLRPSARLPASAQPGAAAARLDAVAARQPSAHSLYAQEQLDAPASPRASQQVRVWPPGGMIRNVRLAERGVSR